MLIKFDNSPCTYTFLYYYSSKDIKSFLTHQGERAHIFEKRSLLTTIGYIWKKWFSSDWAEVELQIHDRKFWVLIYKNDVIHSKKIKSAFYQSIADIQKTHSRQFRKYCKAFGIASV